MADFKAQAESRIRNSRALSMSERGMQSMAGHSSMAGRESMIGRESMAHRDSLNARDPLQSSIRPMSPTDTGTGAQTGTSDGGDVGQAINLAKANFFKLTLIRQLYFILGASITGLGAAAMHYSGIISMRIAGVAIKHDPRFVVLAIVVGLWIIFFLHGTVPRLIAPFVIGAAVFSLHYVAMLGTSFSLNDNPFTLDYDAFFSNNPGVIGGLTIETVRSQVDFTLELVILAIGFHYLKAD
eukprot:jgi/Hompol1/5804/HPOL_001929-RA